MTRRTTSRRTTDFAAALLGLRRILELLADGDAMAGADQLLQILVGGMDRHAAHRDIVALMPAALGERDAEGPRCRFGIVEEQLVEIAHAVEQQAARMGRLDLEILRHHRRRRDSIPGAVVHGVDIVHAGRLAHLVRQVAPARAIRLTLTIRGTARHEPLPSARHHRAAGTIGMSNHEH